MIMCGCVIIPDPVKAEQHEDGLLRARERMQRLQDERAAEHQQKAEEVGADIGPSMTGIHDMGPDVVVSCVLHVTWVHVVWFYVDMGPNVVENRCLTWVLTSQRLVWNTFGWWGIVCYIHTLLVQGKWFRELSRIPVRRFQAARCCC